jgi:hypothetical protein
MTMSAIQQQQQYGLPARLEFVVNLELSEWLMITGKGRQNNLPLVLPAGQTIIGQLVADNQLPYVMVDAIQFDGVLSGQLAFDAASWASKAKSDTEKVELFHGATMSQR